MKELIYMGSTTDGYEYWQEVGETTAGSQRFRRKIGEFYLEPVNNPLAWCAEDIAKSRFNTPEGNITGSKYFNSQR